MSSFQGNTYEIPYGNVDVRLHAVSLNFKDVLNVVPTDKDAYVGYDVIPILGAGFSEMVTDVPRSMSGYTCRLSVGDKYFGLSSDMLRSQALFLIDRIANFSSNLSFEEA